MPHKCFLKYLLLVAMLKLNQIQSFGFFVDPNIVKANIFIIDTDGKEKHLENTKLQLINMYHSLEEFNKVI